VHNFRGIGRAILNPYQSNLQKELSGEHEVVKKLGEKIENTKQDMTRSGNDADEALSNVLKMGGEIRRVDQKSFEVEARIYESNKNTREKMRKLMELKERVKGIVFLPSLINFILNRV